MNVKSWFRLLLLFICAAFIVVLTCMVKITKKNTMVAHQIGLLPNAGQGKDKTIGSECFRAGTSGIHMVIIPFLKYNKTNNTFEAKLLEREKEYKHSLFTNLANPLVQCVHVLTTNAAEPLAIFKNISNKGKMLVSEVRSVDMARDPFEYISENLLGRSVMYASADVYLGAGFDLVDPVAMDKQKIMYAVSRKVAEKDANRSECAHLNLSSTSLEDKCKNRSGSHDVFFFRLHEPLMEQDLAEHLGFDISRFGQESRVMWFFENVLHFCVLNPCKILALYHYHCSGMRTNIYKPRLEHFHFSEPKNPTDQLLCNNSFH